MKKTVRFVTDMIGAAFVMAPFILLMLALILGSAVNL